MCRLFLNLGVVCHPFGTPVAAHVVSQQDVQRGGARSHERVRGSLHKSKAHRSCLPKQWETVWGKTLKNQFGFSAFQKSHGHLSVKPVDVFCHLWIHDVPRPDLSHDGPCILRCLALGIVEIDKHSHDSVIFFKLE